MDLKAVKTKKEPKRAPKPVKVNPKAIVMKSRTMKF